MLEGKETSSGNREPYLKNDTSAAEKTEIGHPEIRSNEGRYVNYTPHLPKAMTLTMISNRACATTALLQPLLTHTHFQPGRDTDIHRLSQPHHATLGPTH